MASPGTGTVPIVSAHFRCLLVLPAQYRVQCLSVRVSVPFVRSTPLLRVCCCGPSESEMLIDCCTAGAQQQPRRSTTRSSKCGQFHVVS